MRAAARALELHVAGGARICVPASLGQMTTYVLLEQEDWFEDEIRFVREWLRPGGRAIDVGASFGMYALAMARAVGSAGRVWAFEPTEESAACLERSLELNGFSHVALQRSAVSNRDGTLEFRAGAESEYNGVPVEGAPAGPMRRVPAASLDREAARHGWSGIEFLKLDVEGHELEAIEGARRLLAEDSPLVMFEIQSGKVIDLRPLEPLAAAGYGFYRLLPGPLWLAPLDLEEIAGLRLLNVFACKPDRAAALAREGRAVSGDAAPARSGATWPALAGRLAYARELSGRWPSKAGFFSGGGLASYLEGLGAYAQFRDEALGAEERHASLGHALRCVNEALDARATLARRLTQARICWELGARQAAVDALEDAVRRLPEESSSAPAEPFLAPLPRYEAVPPGADAAAWMRCAAIESFERQRALSSSFLGTSSLELLAPARGLAACSAQVERRCQLVRMRQGVQAAPEPAAALCARSEENLNPQIWTSGVPIPAVHP